MGGGEKFLYQNVKAKALFDFVLIGCKTSWIRKKEDVNQDDEVTILMDIFFPHFDMHTLPKPINMNWYRVSM